MIFKIIQNIFTILYHNLPEYVISYAGITLFVHQHLSNQYVVAVNLCFFQLSYNVYKHKTKHGFKNQYSFTLKANSAHGYTQMLLVYG